MKLKEYIPHPFYHNTEGHRKLSLSSNGIIHILNGRVLKTIRISHLLYCFLSARQSAPVCMTQIHIFSSADFHWQTAVSCPF